MKTFIIQAVVTVEDEVTEDQIQQQLVTIPEIDMVNNLYIKEEAWD